MIFSPARLRGFAVQFFAAGMLGALHAPFAADFAQEFLYWRGSVHVFKSGWD
jgi:hypothetical protein